jgi:hypothetical protein
MHERIAFIHSYLYDSKRKDAEGNPLPDKPTRACELAAAELYRRRHADKIAFSVFPKLARAIEVRSHKLLSKTLQERDLISIQSSVHTDEEVQAVKNLEEKYHPDKITSICIDPHKNRVINSYKTVFGKDYDKNKFFVKTFNEILNSSSELLPQEIKNRYEGVIKDSDTWPLIKAFKVQEQILPYVLSKPKLGPFLKELSSKYPNAKIFLQKSCLDILSWIYDKTQKNIEYR